MDCVVSQPVPSLWRISNLSENDRDFRALKGARLSLRPESMFIAVRIWRICPAVSGGEFSISESWLVCAETGSTAPLLTAKWPLIMARSPHSAAQCVRLKIAVANSASKSRFAG